MKRRLFYAISLLLLGMHVNAQKITSPKEHFSFEMGADYKLANYQQMESYMLRVAEQSDRIKIEYMGLSEGGNKQHLMIISSPENLRKLDHYKAIAKKMALAKDLSAEEAKQLSQEGKAVVWIDGGMHSNEMVGSHQLMETLYQLLNREDEELKRYLDNVIVLLWHVNPDGQDILANWYMQYPKESDRNMKIPVLYHKYAGHDNNRDYFMTTLKESKHIAKILYQEWFPQIVYNHHQTAPAGAVVAGPPYRNPFNYVYDPMIITGIDAVGAAMINRLNVEDKAGYTRLDGSVFSTWWNGGLRTTPYFHNMIGILTEIIGGPTPSDVPVVADRLLPNNNTPNPVRPQSWNFKKSIDYSLSLNYSILDYASRNADVLLYNIYKMGANAIAKGQTDTWTFYPDYIDSLKNSTKGRTSLKDYAAIFENKDFRDPKVYLIPKDQADYKTALKFLNALIRNGIQVHELTADVQVNGKAYTKGSYLVYTAQAFRPFVLDMFEAQRHPHDLEYVGGPPRRPYDAAGWTLAMQMNVVVDKLYDSVKLPAQALAENQEITMELQKPVSLHKNGYLLSAAENDAFAVVNSLLKQDVAVYRIDEGSQKGDFYFNLKDSKVLGSLSKELQSSLKYASAKPAKLKAVKKLKIGIYDYYGGSMPAGWTMKVLEDFGFDYEVIYASTINQEQLKGFDCLLFMGAGIPAYEGRGSMFRSGAPAEDLVPAAYAQLLDSLSKTKSVPILRNYMAAGGRILASGASAELAYYLEANIQNALLDAQGNKFDSQRFYIPTSLLEVNTVASAASYGLGSKLPIVYNNSPLFDLSKADKTKVQEIIAFGPAVSLLSGWSLGEELMAGKTAGFKLSVGQGDFVAFGPDIVNRTQAHGTFKLLFNQLYGEQLVK